MNLIPEEHNQAIIDGAQELCYKRHKRSSVCRLCLRDIAYLTGQGTMQPTIESQEEQITELKMKITRLIEVHHCTHAVGEKACQFCLEAARG